MKRGQGATEYLVILGAVLLVALVIVSLLGWFPALGGSTREQQSKSYWAGASPFSITAVKHATNNITLSVANRLSDRVTVRGLWLVDSMGNVGVPTIITPTFNGGEEKVVFATAAFTTSNQCATAASGAMFDYARVTIQYDAGTITGLNMTGARPLVGRCS